MSGVSAEFLYTVVAQVRLAPVNTSDLPVVRGKRLFIFQSRNQEPPARVLGLQQGGGSDGDILRIS